MVDSKVNVLGNKLVAVIMEESEGLGQDEIIKILAGLLGVVSEAEGIDTMTVDNPYGSITYTSNEESNETVH